MSPDREKPRFSRRTLLKGGLGAAGATALGAVVGRGLANGDSSTPVPSEQVINTSSEPVDSESLIFSTPMIKIQYSPEWSPSIGTNEDGVDYIKLIQPKRPESEKAGMRFFAEPMDLWQDNLEDYTQHEVDSFIQSNGTVSELSVTDFEVAGIPSKRIIAKVPDRKDGESVFKGFSFIGDVLYVNGQPWRISLASPSDEALYKENHKDYEEVLATLEFKNPY